MSDRSHRRKLGQNYLVDPVILFEMERAINPQEKNLFFEIGRVSSIATISPTLESPFSSWAIIFEVLKITFSCKTISKLQTAVPLSMSLISFPLFIILVIFCSFNLF